MSNDSILRAITDLVSFTTQSLQLCCSPVSVSKLNHIMSVGNASITVKRLYPSTGPILVLLVMIIKTLTIIIMMVLIT